MGQRLCETPTRARIHFEAPRTPGTPSLAADRQKLFPEVLRYQDLPGADHKHNHILGTRNASFPPVSSSRVFFLFSSQIGHTRITKFLMQ